MSPATEMNNIHLLWWLISSQIIIQLKLTSKNSINILQHEERKVAYGGVLSYIFAQTRLEGKNFNLEWPNGDYKSYTMNP